MSYDAQWTVRSPCGAILAEIMVPHWPAADKRIPQELLTAYAASAGNQVHWTSIITTPRKTWSPERKAKERQRRLRQRMESCYPLFAEQFIQAEMAAKPAYYQGH